MTQKVLKVGKSAAVTIPKGMLGELGIKPGDEITVELDKKRGGFFVRTSQGKVKVDKELLDWTEKFIEEYRPALEALAKK